MTGRHRRGKSATTAARELPEHVLPEHVLPEREVTSRPLPHRSSDSLSVFEAEESVGDINDL